MRTWQERTEMRPEVGVEARGMELRWWDCRGGGLVFFVPTFDYSGWLN